MLKAHKLLLYVCNVRDAEMDAYERLIGDGIKGNAMLFARQDPVEAAWRIVDPILNMKTPVHVYNSGAWGSAEANAMVAHIGGWHDFQLPA